MTLPSSRRLVNSHGDAGKGDVADLDSRDDPCCGRGAQERGQRGVKALHRLPEGCDVMAETKVVLQSGLKTTEHTQKTKTCQAHKMNSKSKGDREKQQTKTFDPVPSVLVHYVLLPCLPSVLPKLSQYWS